jgi:LemA protein
MSWLALILLAAAAGIVVLYNRLVRLRNGSENAWSDIDVQLKRRHDLVPNLVETVKGYASHEQETFREVTEARSRATGAGGRAERAGAENALSGALGHLFALAEAYPELRANENFQALQGELSSIEGAIESARRYYNAIVRDLNTACDTIPSNLVASLFGIGKSEYFELDAAEERQAPTVSFS